MIKKIWRANGKIYILKILNEDEEKLYAIDSAPKRWSKVQFAYLDYDRKYPRDWKNTTKMMGWKRSLLVESSPHKWWVLSFSPTPVEKIFWLYWEKRRICRGFAGCFLRFGLSSIRVSEKADSLGYPKIRQVFVNPAGTNFYNYNKEDGFRESLDFFQNKLKLDKE